MCFPCLRRPLHLAIWRLCWIASTTQTKTCRPRHLSSSAPWPTCTIIRYCNVLLQHLPLVFFGKLPWAASVITCFSGFLLASLHTCIIIRYCNVLLCYLLPLPFLLLAFMSNYSVITSFSVFIFAFLFHCIPVQLSGIVICFCGICFLLLFLGKL